MRTSHALLLAVLSIGILAGGCDTGKNKKEAYKQWNSTRAAVQASLATERYKRGNMDEARKAIDDAIKLAPDNAAYRVISARIYIERNQLEMADRELAVGRTVNPRNAEIDYLSGVIYQRWERPQLALDYYTQASEKSPAELPFLMARAEMLVLLNRLNDAVSLLESKLTYYEYSGPLRDMLGGFYMQQNLIPKAIETIHQATILSPEDLIIREHLSRAYFRGTKYRECLDQIDLLVKNEQYAKRADLLLTKGECLIQLEQWRDARFALEASLEIFPASMPALISLAKVSLKTSDLDRAELCVRKAISIAPDDARVHLTQGYVRLRQQRWEDALTSFRKANTLDPKDPVALCLMGLVYEKTGRHDQAMQYYGQAIQIQPDSALASKLMSKAK